MVRPDINYPRGLSAARGGAGLVVELELLDHFVQLRDGVLELFDLALFGLFAVFEGLDPVLVGLYPRYEDLLNLFQSFHGSRIEDYLII